MRVVCSIKGGKHSKYTSLEGNLCDGIYKAVRYWPEKRKSGFLMKHYLLWREDEESDPSQGRESWN